MGMTNEEKEEMARFLEQKTSVGSALNLKEGQDVTIRLESITLKRHKRGNRTVLGHVLQIDEVDGKPVKMSIEYLSKDFNRLVMPYEGDVQGKKFILGYTKDAEHQRVWKFEPCEEGV